MKTLALILAGGRGSRLDILSENRAKPSVPFGGKYRLIDFALSNCVNSGIYNIGVLTQYLPMSLNNHIGIGKPWDLDRKLGGVTILQPYTGKKGGWYEGTAHSVRRNIDYIKKQNPEYVLILSGDHVYKMNYNKMIKEHEKKNADLTIAAQRVSYAEASRFGILVPDDNMKITNFKEKPEKPTSNLASMGIYIFSTDILIDMLEKYCSQKNSDFGHHIIPKVINKGKAFLYQYEGYWKDVGTLESFWKTNLALTKAVPEINLYDSSWKIHTRSEEKPSVKFGPEGRAIRSLVSNGSIINGEVENSVISPGVVIGKGSVVRNCIIFNDTIVKRDSIVCKSIIDKDVTIGSNSHIGFGSDVTANNEIPKLLNCGLNVVGKGSNIPANIQIGLNCRILPYVKKEDFKKEVISSGSTVKPYLSNYVESKKESAASKEG